MIIIRTIHIRILQCINSYIYNVYEYVHYIHKLCMELGMWHYTVYIVQCTRIIR